MPPDVSTRPANRAPRVNGRVESGGYLVVATMSKTELPPGDPS